MESEYPPLPKKTKDRKVGAFYTYKGEPRYWDGKKLRCPHKRDFSNCEKCVKKYFCVVCDAKFTSEDFYSKHMWSHYPNLVDEYDETRNSKPIAAYTLRSGKSVWWRCKTVKCECHVWKTKIYARTRKKSPTGCPYCGQGSLVCSHMWEPYQNLLEEYHTDKELNPKPLTEYRPGSDTLVWWKCSNDPCGCHVWQVKIQQRTNINKLTGCPYCSSGGALACYHMWEPYPHLLKEYHPDKKLNSRPLTDYKPKSHTYVWWKCSNDPCGCHIWQTRIDYRTESNNPTGCPYCNIGTLSCKHIWEPYPHLLKEYHGDVKLNPKPLIDFRLRSNRKVWWQCSKNSTHQWQSVIHIRTGGCGCPYCKISRGEKCIEEFLTNHKISFVGQKRFCDCRDLYTLPFDFFLPDHKLIIEYDGRMHFMFNPYFHRKKRNNFEDRRKKDLIKTCFCASNKFHLLRISYLEFDHINQLLHNVLSIITDGTSHPRFFTDIASYISNHLKNRDIDERFEKVNSIYEEHHIAFSEAIV